MSNKVWVTWKLPDGTYVDPTRVKNLPNDSIVDDLRDLFVEQQKLTVGSGRLSVFEMEGGEKLEADDKLKDYFAAPEGSGPGQSKDTALFVTFPSRENDSALGPGVVEKLYKSVFYMKDEHRKPIGTGFTISSDRALSAAHVLKSLKVGAQITGYLGHPHEGIVYKFQLVNADAKADFCVLKRREGHGDDFLSYLTPAVPRMVPAMKCFLIAFQIGLEQNAAAIGDVPGMVDVGVWPGSVVKRRGNHFVYSCESFAGDSGGAIIVRNGEVFGVHQETVNEARERKDNLVDDELIEDISKSVKSLIDSSSTGSIGFLISAIEY